MNQGKKSCGAVLKKKFDSELSLDFPLNDGETAESEDLSFALTGSQVTLNSRSSRPSSGASKCSSRSLPSSYKGKINDFKTRPRENKNLKAVMSALPPNGKEASMKNRTNTSSKTSNSSINSTLKNKFKELPKCRPTRSLESLLNQKPSKVSYHCPLKKDKSSSPFRDLGCLKSSSKEAKSVSFNAVDHLPVSLESNSNVSSNHLSIPISNQDKIEKWLASSDMTDAANSNDDTVAKNLSSIFGKSDYLKHKYTALSIISNLEKNSPEFICDENTNKIKPVSYPDDENSLVKNVSDDINVKQSAPEQRFHEIGLSTEVLNSMDNKIGIPEAEEMSENDQRRSSMYQEIMNTLELIEKEDLSNEGKLVGDTQAPSLPLNFKQSDKKYRDILTFLEEIDQPPQEPTTELETPASRYCPYVRSGDSSTALELELKEKNRMLCTLKKKLSHQEELTIRNTVNTEREMKDKLMQQKADYESTIQRHQAFIDQLISEKKSLSERCDSLSRDMQVLEKKHCDKIRALEERHNQEIKKTKDMHQSAEKIRKEKLIDEKTKKIKELAIKGLQPEIQKLVDKHHEEINKMRAQHHTEMMKMEENLRLQGLQQAEDLRLKHLKDIEEACNQERGVMRSRHEKQLEDERQMYVTQKRLLISEFEQEKARLKEEVDKCRQDCVAMQITCEQKLAEGLLKAKEDHDRDAEQFKELFQKETAELLKRFEEEKRILEIQHEKNLQETLSFREKDLRSLLKQERDQQIDAVIQRLEDESEKLKSELESTYEAKIKKLREKFDTDMKEMEANEEIFKCRINELKSRCDSLEENSLEQASQLKKKDRELTELREIAELYHTERTNLADQINKEFEERISKLSEDNQKLKREIHRLTDQLDSEREESMVKFRTMDRNKETELNALHQRVKHIVNKRDTALAELRQDYDNALFRAEQLEELLEQQRKQILTTRGQDGSADKKLKGRSRMSSAKSNNLYFLEEIARKT